MKFVSLVQLYNFPPVCNDILELDYYFPVEKLGVERKEEGELKGFFYKCKCQWTEIDASIFDYSGRTLLLYHGRRGARPAGWLPRQQLMQLQ